MGGGGEEQEGRQGKRIEKGRKGLTENGVFRGLVFLGVD